MLKNFAQLQQLQFYLMQKDLFISSHRHLDRYYNVFYTGLLLKTIQKCLLFQNSLHISCFLAMRTYDTNFVGSILVTITLTDTMLSVGLSP